MFLDIQLWWCKVMSLSCDAELVAVVKTGIVGDNQRHI